MVNKRKKPMLYILTFLLICTTFITMFGVSAFAAIDWTYSGISGSGSGGGDKLVKSSYAIARVEADMNLITADFTFKNGYIWVEYTKTTYDDSDEIIDKGRYLAYWKMKKENGIWKVTKIKEQAVSADD